ncbi:MAG: AraC family transcriptional regulator, partial [Pseudomonadota bacterium]
MARAISVHHGSFGRATLYELDKPLTTHAHREGHIVFYLGGPDASIAVNDEPYPISKTSGVAVSPWEPHSFHPSPCGQTHFVLTLYIKPMWFLENSHSAEFALSFGTPVVQMTPTVEMWVGRLTSLLLDDQASDRFDGFLFETTRQCFDQSWQAVQGRALLQNVQRRFN